MEKHPEPKVREHCECSGKRGCQHNENGICKAPERCCANCGYHNERCDVNPYHWGYSLHFTGSDDQPIFIYPDNPHGERRNVSSRLGDMHIEYARCSKCGYVPLEDIKIVFDIGSTPEDHDFRYLSIPVAIERWVKDAPWLLARADEIHKACDEQRAYEEWERGRDRDDEEYF